MGYFYGVSRLASPSARICSVVLAHHHHEPLYGRTLTLRQIYVSRMTLCPDDLHTRQMGGDQMPLPQAHASKSSGRLINGLWILPKYRGSLIKTVDC